MNQDHIRSYTGDTSSKVIVDLREVTSPKPGVIAVAERPDLPDTAYVTSDKQGDVDHNGFALSFSGGEVLKIHSDGKGTITETEPDDQFIVTASKSPDGRTAVSVIGKCLDN